MEYCHTLAPVGIDKRANIVYYMTVEYTGYPVKIYLHKGKNAMNKLLKKALALLLCASVLLTGCASNGDSSVLSEEQSTVSAESKPDSSAAPESSESSSETSSSQESQSAQESQPSEESSDFGISWQLSSTWEQDGSFCGGYNVVIANNTGSAIESWTVETEVPDGFQLSSQWNGEFSVDGTKLTISNAEYNGAIESGATVTFGFNYMSPEEFTPGESKVNGKPADDSVTVGDNNQNSEPAQSTEPVETLPPAPEDPDGSTPVSQHGQLSVKGTQLVDENGKGYQLKGMSTHGIGWFPDFVNEDAFRTLRDDWNANAIRLAMYSGAGEGYTGDGIGTYESLMKKGIEIAIKLDMYVICDWHVLADQSPQVRKADALRFFDEISKAYGKYPNIVYEICNEPNGSATWDGDVKPYAEEVIPVIRANDPDSVIIVGTPTWSQDIDKAMAFPLEYDNLLYALHFYAATHTDWLRQRVSDCVANGLPVIVSEFGMCDASGGGSNDFNQAKAWLELLDSLGISYFNWSICNKAETCSALKPSASPNGNWSESDLSDGGAWIRKWLRGEQ